jgi:hypothetical protein
MFSSAWRGPSQAEYDPVDLPEVSPDRTYRVDRLLEQYGPDIATPEIDLGNVVVALNQLHHLLQHRGQLAVLRVECYNLPKVSPGVVDRVLRVSGRLSKLCTVGGSQVRGKMRLPPKMRTG